MPDFTDIGGRDDDDADHVAAADKWLDAMSAQHAILVPVGASVHPEMRLEAAVAKALNQWLADSWLSKFNSAGRYLGSIRVSVQDAHSAIGEIERWAADKRFVQVVVPAETAIPYGHQMYFPIWEAASKHGLPVLITADDRAGVGNPWKTVVGHPAHYTEYATLSPLTMVSHLTSLIADGVFERLPDLIFVFADGAFDHLPLVWRLDKDWRGVRTEAPWLRQPPSKYIPAHVRFILHGFDGPTSAERFKKAVELFGGPDLFMFGSRYPRWDQVSADVVVGSLPSGLAEKVVRLNAAKTYGLKSEALSS